MFLLRNIKAYLRPNMIKLDGVDFKECRSEEVKSFFWRSVYVQKKLVAGWFYSTEIYLLSHKVFRKKKNLVCKLI